MQSPAKPVSTFPILPSGKTKASCRWGQDGRQRRLLRLGRRLQRESAGKNTTKLIELVVVHLAFYDRLLRAYVRIDLKIGKLTHQDLGQMQMYVNYFDRHSDSVSFYS